MHQDNDSSDVHVSLENSWNPYEDKTLTESQSDAPILSQREPFNDVVKHGDIIVGHQQNRTLSDYPRRSRAWVRLYAVITLLLMAFGILSIFVHL